MNSALLPKQETGLLGSIRDTGLSDFGRAAFNDDGSRKSFSDTKASLKDISDMGRIASLAGAVTSNKDLAGLGAGVSQAAGIASDPSRGLLGMALGRAMPSPLASAAMGAFDANRNDRDVVDTAAKAGLTALASKVAFGAFPVLGIANAFSGLMGGPTIGTMVRDGVNYFADSMDGIDPATSIRTVTADLDDAGWRSPKAPTEQDIPDPTDDEMAAAPEQQQAPDDGSFEDVGSGWGGGGNYSGGYDGGETYGW